jgi:hypothetical protein
LSLRFSNMTVVSLSVGWARGFDRGLARRARIFKS